MNAEDKLKVMKVANWLIEQLMDCGDVEFADRVLEAISGGEKFSYDEMKRIVGAIE